MMNRLKIAILYGKAKKRSMLIMIFLVVILTLISSVMTSLSMSTGNLMENELGKQIGLVDLIVSYEANINDAESIERTLNIDTGYSYGLAVLALDYSYLTSSKTNHQMYTVYNDNNLVTMKRYHRNFILNNNEIALSSSASDILNVKSGDVLKSYNGNTFEELFVKEIIDNVSSTPVIVLSTDLIRNTENKVEFSVLIDFNDISSEKNQIYLDELLSNPNYRVQALSSDQNYNNIVEAVAKYSGILRLSILLASFMIIQLFMRSFLHNNIVDFKALRFHGYKAIDIMWIFLLISLVSTMIGTLIGSLLSIPLSYFIFGLLQLSINIRVIYIIGSNLLSAFIVVVIVNGSLWNIIKNMPVRILESYTIFKRKSILNSSISIFLAIASVISILLGLAFAKYSGVGLVGVLMLFALYFLNGKKILAKGIDLLDVISFKVTKRRVISLKLIKPYIKYNSIIIHSIAFAFMAFSMSVLIFNTINYNMYQNTEQDYSYGNNAVLSTVFSKDRVIIMDNFDEILSSDEVNNYMVRTGYYSSEIINVNDNKTENLHISILGLNFDGANKFGIIDEKLDSHYAYLSRSQSKAFDLEEGDRITLLRSSDQILRREIVILDDADMFLGRNDVVYIDLYSENVVTNKWAIDELYLDFVVDVGTISYSDIKDMTDDMEDIYLRTKASDEEKIESEAYSKGSLVLTLIVMFLVFAIICLVMSLYSFLGNQRSDYIFLIRHYIKKTELGKILLYQMLIIVAISIIISIIITIGFIVMITSVLHETLYFNMKSILLIISIIVVVSVSIILPFASVFTKRSHLERLNSEIMY